MKVYEIITESKITEAGLKASVLSSLLGKGAEVAANLIGKGPKGRALEKLAQAFSHAAEVGEKVHPNRIQKIVGKELASDPKFIAQAEKEAAKLTKISKYEANAAVLSKATGNIKNVAAGLTRLAAGAWWLKEILDPLSMYWSNIQNAEEYVAANRLPDGIQWNGDVNSWFQAYRKQEMSTLIGRWAALWAARKMVAVPFKVVNGILSTVAGKQIIKGGLLNTAGQAAFMSWVNNPENSQSIATAMAYWIIPDVVGGLGVTAVDAIKGAVTSSAHATPEEEPTTAPTATTQTPSADANATPQSQPAGAQPAKTTAPAATSEKPAAPVDRSTWKDIGGGYIKNPATGDIEVKVR